MLEEGQQMPDVQESGRGVSPRAQRQAETSWNGHLQPAVEILPFSRDQWGEPQKGEKREQPPLQDRQLSEL